jgi:hypothetical protein
VREPDAVPDATHDHMKTPASPLPITRPARLVLILCTFLIVGTVWLSRSALGYGDFPQLHDSARAILAGENIYTSGAISLQGTRNLNPPHLVLLMSPLGLLPLDAAASAMWAVILGAVLFFAMAVLRNVGPEAGWMVFAVILISSASTVAISLINIAWPLAAATAWAYSWLRAGHLRRAAVAVGCLASVKLFYLVFLPYWIWRRDWRAATWFTAAFGAVFGLGILALGWEPYTAWITVLETGSPLSSDRPMDASWHSVVTHFAGAGAAAQWAWIASVVCIALTTWWRLRRSPADARDWAVLLIVMLVVSPLGWVYYVLIPALPAAVVMLERQQRVPMKLIATGLAVPPALVVLLAERAPGAFATALLNSLYGMTLVFAWLVLTVGHPSRVQVDRRT